MDGKPWSGVLIAALAGPALWCSPRVPQTRNQPAR